MIIPLLFLFPEDVKKDGNFHPDTNISIARAMTVILVDDNGMGFIIKDRDATNVGKTVEWK